MSKRRCSCTNTPVCISDRPLMCAQRLRDVSGPNYCPFRDRHLIGCRVLSNSCKASCSSIPFFHLTSTCFVGTRYLLHLNNCGKRDRRITTSLMATMHRHTFGSSPNGTAIAMTRLGNNDHCGCKRQRGRKVVKRTSG